jgi:hypothetical protein
VYDDYFGVRGFVDCSDGVAGIDWDAERADCGGRR